MMQTNTHNEGSSQLNIKPESDAHNENRTKGDQTKESKPKIYICFNAPHKPRFHNIHMHYAYCIHNI